MLAAGLAKNTALRALWLNGNHVKVEGAKALSKVIDENRTLRELWLYDDDSLGEGVASLLASLEGNTNIRCLYLPRHYQCCADPRVTWY